MDEIGNSPPEFQDLLLAFVESGRAEPEFRTNTMTQDAVGPLNVLCIFTAQPRHIRKKTIKIDMVRRFSRGAKIELPPLHERPEDIVPTFYQSLRAYRSRDPLWTEPDNLGEIIAPPAQEYLRKNVIEKKLSASFVADLAGETAISVIGVPYLKERLANVKSPSKKKRIQERDVDDAAELDLAQAVARIVESAPPNGSWRSLTETTLTDLHEQLKGKVLDTIAALVIWACFRSKDVNDMARYLGPANQQNAKGVSAQQLIKRLLKLDTKVGERVKEFLSAARTKIPEKIASILEDVLKEKEEAGPRASHAANEKKKKKGPANRPDPNSAQT